MISLVQIVVALEPYYMNRSSRTVHNAACNCESRSLRLVKLRVVLYGLQYGWKSTAYDNYIICSYFPSLTRYFTGQFGGNALVTIHV